MKTLLLAALCAAIPVVATAAPVRVLYAGSLVNLMERGIGPGFDKAGGNEFEGYAGGSGALVNQIKGKLRAGDVFITANPALNDKLTGPANGNWVSWYVTFAQSPLVLGINPSSRFANDFKTRPWYEVLSEPGIRIGRTDPKLDPKGALTVKLLDHAQSVYGKPGLANRILGKAENPAQVQPEESLAGRLQSGQIDVGFFYATETSDLHIPAVALPKEVALQANYAVAILRGAPNAAGALQFVTFLLGPQGRAVMQAHGLEVAHPVVAGDQAAIPVFVRAELNAAE